MSRGLILHTRKWKAAQVKAGNDPMSTQSRLCFPSPAGRQTIQIVCSKSRQIKMKWTCILNILLVALTSAAPLQIPPLLQANFDDLQPGTRFQRTPYNSLQFSGVIVKDKGPRAIFPDTEPNYILQYYDPAPRGPLMSVEGTGASSFDFNGFAAGCLWDTAKSGVGAGNSTTAPLPPITDTAGEPNSANGLSNNGTDSLDAPHYPCIACTIEITCRTALGAVSRQSLDWRPGTSWSSNIMARYLGFGSSWKGMSFCNVQVTQAPVEVEEIILVLDSIQYRVNDEQAAGGRPAVDVT
ncbi:MAG: hypothetical protein OHK93_000065 [Ramalina farinacea]|uniref:Uncharacterized protein n=1 Tax=Ramalina farinacea TaxID=258253 RepID=A0AA43QHG5_9LECA|nr:hypothetical protein [Ramalina farinacea]